MADQKNVLLSNRVIGFIGMLLMAGILLDGRAYNRTPETEGIYLLDGPGTIAIHQQNNALMVFEKIDDQWTMTQPVHAPLNTERVNVLLDSNKQVSRSYAASDLPLADLFQDPLQLDINGKQFQFGELEPVSKLRYVMAGNRVYLQADHVIPMIRAGVTAFLDLKITDQVTHVEIDQQTIKMTESWSSLQALGVVPRGKLTSEAIATITLEEKDRDQKGIPATSARWRGDTGISAGSLRLSDFRRAIQEARSDTGQ